jgi:hypothetical protein
MSIKRGIVRLTLPVLLVGAVGGTFGGTAFADANGKASCVGLETSSISPPGSSNELPGGAAEFGEEVQAIASELGIPPGAVYSTFAKIHAGSHDACDEAAE